MALPIRTRPRFLHSQSFPSGIFHKPLIYQREDRMKNENHRKLSKLITWITACLTQGNYEPCLVEPLRMNASWWRFLTKHGPLEKGMADHFGILASRTPRTIWKGKKSLHWKMNSPGRQVPNILLEKSIEITQERMKRLGQKQNNIQLWIWLVMEVKSDAVKDNIV